jgi:PKD domain
VATAVPASGGAPLTVQLDGTASTGRGLTYAWDLDGDGQFDDATGARPSASFPAGTYSVRVQVTDASGVAAVSAPLTVTAEVTQPPPGVASSAPSTAAPAPRVRARLVRRHRPVMLRRDGSVVLRVHCPSQTACAGSLVVRTLNGGPALRGARFTVPARRAISVRVRLGAAGRRVLARHTRIRAISIAALGPSGGTIWRTDTVFTLRAPQRAAGAPRDARRPA